MIFESVIDTIICDDCIKAMKEIPDKCIDAVVTDPPFAFAGGISNGMSSSVDNQFFTYWWRGVCDELQRILKPGGEGFIWCDWRTAPLIGDGFKPKQQTYSSWRVPQVIYHYREMVGQGQPFRSSVDMIAYARGPESKGHRIPNTTENWISKFWYYGKHEYHPAEKDVEIAKQLINWCSDENNVILDPFAGSGTTCVAAKMLNRKFIGIEIESDYVKIAQKRIDKIHGVQSAINSSETDTTLDAYVNNQSKPIDA